MKWGKAVLKKLEKEGRLRTVYFPPEPKNRVKIPGSVGKYKLHIISVLEKSGLDFVSEFRFDEKRKFRFDWAVPAHKIAIEYEGIFSEKSSHTTLQGYNKDIIKYNLATKLEWRVLRYTADNYLDVEEDLKNITSLKSQSI